MSLVTQLLADAVKKGGPGSGPQGGRRSSNGVGRIRTGRDGKKSISGTRNAESAVSSKEHKKAADMHETLSQHLRASGDSKNADLHHQAANAHASAGSSFRDRASFSEARTASITANGDTSAHSNAFRTGR